jgi:hypothetical protein
MKRIYLRKMRAGCAGALLSAFALSAAQFWAHGQPPVTVPAQPASGSAAPSDASGLQPSSKAPADRAVVQSYGKLPLSFEPNRGQTAQSVKFLARGSGYTLFLTNQEAVLSLAGGKAKPAGRPGNSKAGARSAGALSQSRTALRMKLVGANPDASVEGTDELPGKSNYFIGSDRANWHTNVPNYSKVRYHNVYPGVDLVYYGNQGRLEYDFVVAPGADSGQIALSFKGAKRLRIDPVTGDLLLKATAGEVRFHKPVVYQPASGSAVDQNSPAAAKMPVQGSFRTAGHGRMTFEIAAYDHTRPLVIDPRLSYSTYLGGNSNDSGNGIAVDASGNAYVVGLTPSTDFPTQNPLQPSNHGNGDAFVTKLNAAGSALVYSTYLGGSSEDWGLGIAVDSSGNAYVTGYTFSTDFPTQNPLQAFNHGLADAFVAKLNAAGSALVYSTYLGGRNFDQSHRIAVDASGNAYVTGSTDSTDFPTQNPLQPSNHGNGDAFVTKLNAAGSAFVYSTYLGGSDQDYGYGIAVDASGNAYMTGSTNSTDFPTRNPYQASKHLGVVAFITKLNAPGSALVYSTYLGGSSGDSGKGIAVDASGNAYVTGSTNSTDFPTRNPLQTSNHGLGDAFVTKLNATGSALVYSTYLGGSSSDLAVGITVDASGNAYVTGYTYSTDFPTRNPLQASNHGPPDSFVTKLNAPGSALVYSTYLGGVSTDTGLGITVDASRSAYVTGGTVSNDFPTQNPYQSSNRGGQDAFVAKISVPAVHTSGDFDGDSKADLAIFRPSTGFWYIDSSLNPMSPVDARWGLTNDIPVVGDFDGDGKDDIAVWRPSTGIWYVIPSGNPANTIAQNWGMSGDIPVPGDYDGDGRTDIAVWRPSTGMWYVLPSSRPGTAVAQQWGTSTDVPVPADYDGDGRTDIAVWRPSTGMWYVIPSGNPGVSLVQLWGLSTDIPVPGDYDGDGKADFAVWRPSNGTWYVIPSITPGSSIAQQFGTSGDIPVPRDYDGDGTTDMAVWRPSIGTWYVLPSSMPGSSTATQWGAPGDVPVNMPVGQ